MLDSITEIALLSYVSAAALPIIQGISIPMGDLTMWLFDGMDSLLNMVGVIQVAADGTGTVTGTGEVIGMAQSVSGMAALLAGILSFISPCVLPLVPAYLSFMSGLSVDHMQSAGEGVDRRQVMIRAGLTSLFFVLGFSTIFVLMGASAFALRQVLLAYKQTLTMVGGGLIILFGLHFMGLFRFLFLEREARFNVQRKPPGVLGAFVIGLAFAFGWTPCIGPILMTILGIAAAQESVWQGVGLLAIYSAGLGIPFIVAGLAINTFFTLFTRLRRHMRVVEIVSGLFMVMVGVLILMGDLAMLGGWLLDRFPALGKLG